MIIGKNIVTILTSGLYGNPLFLYREYIQNAADQIDIAKKLGNRQIEERIYITIDKEERSVTIEDRATGIESRQVDRLLGNIACSEKNGVDSKGCFGIGRLGALAYCSKLVFETSSFGEKVKSIRSWDADKLRKIVSDDSIELDAVQTFESIVSGSTQQENPEHVYFKVTLHGILPNIDTLLDVQKIREYLKMTAPVPFDGSKFSLSGKIREFASKHNFTIPTYDIRLLGEDIAKPYKRTIDSEDRENPLKDIETHIFKDEQGHVLAWCWIGIRKELKSLPARVPTRCIRLRQHNIQIGDENTLKKLFQTDARAHGYYIGEIHVVCPDFKPTASREYFQITPDFSRFEQQLIDFFAPLWERVRKESDVRGKTKALKKLQNIYLDIETKKKEGFLSRDDKIALEHKYEEQKIKSKAAYSWLQKRNIDVSQHLAQMSPKVKEEFDHYEEQSSTIENLKPRPEKPENSIRSSRIPLVTDKLTTYPKKERQLIQYVLKILSKCLIKETDKYKELEEKIIADLLKRKPH